MLNWSFRGVRVVTVKKGHEKIRAEMENVISTQLCLQQFFIQNFFHWKEDYYLKANVLYRKLLTSKIGKEQFMTYPQHPSQAWFCQTWEICEEIAEAQYCMERDVRTQSLSRLRNCAARKINGTPYHTSWSWDMCTGTEIFTQKREKINKIQFSS